MPTWAYASATVAATWPASNTMVAEASPVWTFASVAGFNTGSVARTGCRRHKPTSESAASEAAAWRGRPVYYRLIGEWTKPERMQPAAGNTPWYVLVAIYLVFGAACFIARFNYKQGRVDRRGALAMALLYLVCMAGGQYLASPHSATEEEFGTFVSAMALAGVNGVLVWVFYLALEPWVRKSWPHTMIGWTRYVTKGIRDPLVGRDLLIGAAAAALFAVISYVQTASHGASGAPDTPALGMLTGLRQSLFLVSQSVCNSLFTSVFFFFIFFVLRALLRKQWLATAAFVLLTAAVFMSSPGGQWIDKPFHLVYAALCAFILLRFGLLALIVALAAQNALSDVPWTAEMSALNLVAMGSVALIAVYGFRTSLAGRSLLRGDLL